MGPYFPERCRRPRTHGRGSRLTAEIFDARPCTSAQGHWGDGRHAKAHFAGATGDVLMPAVGPVSARPNEGRQFCVILINTSAFEKKREEKEKKSGGRGGGE